MKKILAFAFFALAATACTAGSSTPKINIQRVATIFGPGCHIAVTLPVSEQGGIGNGGQPNGGTGGLAVNPIPKSWKSSLDGLGFALNCPDADTTQGTKLAHFNETTHLWQKDLDARFGKMTPDDRKMLDKATRLFNIQAVNSTGYAIYEDDTIGDEEKRGRHMEFCLFHPPKALCGGGTVAYFPDGPKGDLTKRALEIIKSIEFLDDAPPVPRSPVASEPHQ